MDCTWGQWSAWGTCSVTCGGGTQASTRTHEQEQQNGGSACAGASNRTQSCNTAVCNPGTSKRNYYHQSKINNISTKGCTDHSTTGNCATLLTQLAEMNDTALVQFLCENSLGQTLCQRTCHDIFYTCGIDGTFCWSKAWPEQIITSKCGHEIAENMMQEVSNM